ncbi:MAG: ATP-binding cassette domain-containing protein [Geminicoccaceae bacterium]
MTDISVEEGEFLVLVGPSGCGKSTLLNMIAGLEEVTSGDIDQGLQHERGQARGSQHCHGVPVLRALSEQTVKGNISSVHGNARSREGERERRIAEAAELLQIAHLLNRKPGQPRAVNVSAWRWGGALVRDPDVFLFGRAIVQPDAKLRVDMHGDHKAAPETGYDHHLRHA